jgi:hypothetical protein
MCCVQVELVPVAQVQQLTDHLQLSWQLQMI